MASDMVSRDADARRFTRSGQISAEFARRLGLLEGSGQVSVLARRLTELALAEIADEFDLTFTESNAAPFVTHLAMALTRLNRGEPEVPPSDIVEEEIAFRTKEREVVHAVMKDCERLLDREIPESEIAFVTVHLCALLDAAQRTA